MSGHVHGFGWHLEDRVQDRVQQYLQANGHPERVLRHSSRPRKPEQESHQLLVVPSALRGRWQQLRTRVPPFVACNVAPPQPCSHSACGPEKLLPGLHFHLLKICKWSQNT